MVVAITDVRCALVASALNWQRKGLGFKYLHQGRCIFSDFSTTGAS